MEFTKFHKDYFSASSGSFSRVTDREYIDSQITLTDFEAAIVFEHFGHNDIHVGNVASNRQKSSKHFLLYPRLSEITLNLVFPKPNKPELRLYLSSSSGFKPMGGQIWFFYKTKFNDLVVGALNEEDWAKIGQADDLDEKYQESIEKALSGKIEVAETLEGKITVSTLGARKVYLRNPKIAIRRFQEANYQCEMNSSHKTFISLATNKPYMEAHHFIPMKFQHLFEEPLDTLTNVVSLCPTCHRGIHHATVDHKSFIIDKLYKIRPEIQTYKLDEISQFYNCITI